MTTSFSRIPPPIPDVLAAGIGHGDFWAIGRNTVALLERFAGLGKGERILDVGSGLGRVAWPLAGALDPTSTYDGFDTCALYVAYARETLGLDPARFRFHHFDIYSGLYNPAGSIRTSEFRFPWPANTFTLAIAASLFTHLLYDDAAHYLCEIARTLAQGGRLYGTLFIIDEHSRALISNGGTYPAFVASTKHGMLADPDTCEAGVAIERTALFAALHDAGLDVEVLERGSWRREAGPEHQDVVVARKR